MVFEYTHCNKEFSKMFNLIIYILISLIIIHIEVHTIKSRHDEVIDNYKILNMNFASHQGKCIS